MNCTHHLLQMDNERDPNGAALAQPNLAPLGPPPMVLQNPLPQQGMVKIHTLVPQTPATTSAAQPIDPSVH